MSYVWLSRVLNVMLSYIMLSAVKPSVVILNAIMLSTVVLCAIKQILIMVNVMAPFIWLEMFELVKKV